MAQLIGGQHVDAGEVEHKIGLHLGQQAGQGFGQQGQVFGVGGAVGQGQVEVGLLFTGGVVAAAVHRKRKHLRLVAKNSGRAIALVHVEVNNQHFRGVAVGQQPGGSSGLVV